jgi:hypothetical protein
MTATAGEKNEREEYAENGRKTPEFMETMKSM